MKNHPVNIDRPRRKVAATIAKPKPAATENGGAQGVGLLLKALQILDLFSDERPTWTQAELTRETGLARSTLSRLVRFLCARGYLLFQEQRGRYSLGYAAIDLGRRAQAHFSLVDVCLDLIEDLAQATAETVILTGYDEVHARVVCLVQIPSRHGGLRVFESIGTTFPLHAGATAKAVLAFIPPAQAEAILAGDLTLPNPAVATSAAKLKREIAAIQAQGYALSLEETYPGVAGIGIPLLTPSGRPLGSIAVAAPMQRMPEDTIADYARLLLAAAQTARARIAGSE